MNDIKMCILCQRHPAKYSCNGGCMDHLDNNVVYCGYCCRKKIVLWIHHAMEQRLCAVCALRDEKDSREDGIFDARYYSVEQLQEAINKQDAINSD